MQALVQTQKSVLLIRQSSALTFLLNKYKNTKRNFGYRLCKVENYRFSIPHYA